MILMTVLATRWTNPTARSRGSAIGAAASIARPLSDQRDRQHGHQDHSE